MTRFQLFSLVRLFAAAAVVVVVVAFAVFVCFIIIFVCYYVPDNNGSVMSGRFPGLNQYLTADNLSFLLKDTTQ